jgi:hypothetical protein
MVMKAGGPVITDSLKVLVTAVLLPATAVTVTDPPPGAVAATSAGAIAMPSAPVMALALVAPPIKLAGSPERIV